MRKMEHKIIIQQKDGEPQSAWHDGLPIGNGRLGAMVQGSQFAQGQYAQAETISLNEDSLWYGRHQDRNNPDGRKYLQKIRELFRQGKVKEADNLCYMAMASVPKYFGAYEPMGTLCLFYDHADPVQNCRQELDLNTAIVSMSYEADGRKVSRECFVSYPDQVMVFRFHADRPELTVRVHLMRRAHEAGTTVVEESVLYMPGQCGPEGIRFHCMLSAKSDGEMRRIGDCLDFRDASEIILYVTANSDFYEDKPYEKTLQELHHAMETDYAVLKERHIADYQSLYRRASIDFGTSSEESASSRLNKLRSGEKDNGLLELLFHYGRYLMISSSRPGTRAMNLQGIWNPVFAPGWECNYTININTQMNYWIAETTGLSECHEPLFDLIERMVPNGERTAQCLYGCDGFVAHHATNLWGDTAMESNWCAAFAWPMGGAWLSLHLWEHYLYTGDKEFLADRAFPVLKKAAQFFSGYLVIGEDGYYETGPSSSPENAYRTADGVQARICMAPEMDNQIVRALFHALLRACEILGCCEETYEHYQWIDSHIRPVRINRHGGILEWDRDYEEVETGHRHLSPLFGLYPDDQILRSGTPKLAEACKKTLERRRSRMEGPWGWSDVWASACYARLGMAKEARDCLENLLKNAVSESLLHIFPSFQIDANMGAGAAIVEMLLRSNDREMVLLPALPEDIENGSFRGLRGKGGFVIDADWRKGRLVKAAVTSLNGNLCRVKAKGCKAVNKQPYVWEEDFLVFSTEAGKVYELLFA